MEVEKEAATGDEAKEEDVPSLPSLGLLGAAWLIQLPPPPRSLVPPPPQYHCTGREADFMGL